MHNMTHGQVFLAQAGWDDTDDVFFPGTTEDDGHTLVRCQLYSGRDITKDHTPDRAQGTKLVCHVADGVFKVPAKGASLYVIIPHGMEGVAGAGLIIASVTPGPERKSNITEGEVTLAGMAGQGRVRIKADGTVTLYTNDTNTDDGSAIFFRISTKGLEFCSPFGRFRFDASGFHIATAAGPSLDMGGVDLSGVPGIGALPGAVVNALSGYFTVTSPMFTAEAGMVRLGAGALPVPVIYTPLPATVGASPGTGIPTVVGPSPLLQYSNSVYVSQ